MLYWDQPRRQQKFQVTILQCSRYCIVQSHIGSIIYLQQQQEQEKVSLVANEIFDQEIVQNLVNMVPDSSLPHSQVSNLITLIGNLACIDAGYIVKQGGLTVCIDWSLRMLREKKINRAYLDQIYSFFEMMSKKIHLIPNNYNFSDQVFKLFTEFIQVDQSSELMARLLTTIRTILACKKQVVYSNFLNTTSLVKKLFHLSIHNQESIREICWGIFAYVSSSASKVKEIFLDNKFMEAILIAYQKQPIPNGRFDKITQFMLVCVSNLAVEGDQMKERIMHHPIMNVIYDSTHEERSMNLKKNAFYCLCTLITTENYNLMRWAIYESRIFEKLVLGIDQMLGKCSYTTCDIISSISDALQIDRRVFRYNQEGLLEILQSRYNLTNILVRVEQKYSNRPDIIRICSFIFDLSSCQ